MSAAVEAEVIIVGGGPLRLISAAELDAKAFTGRYREPRVNHPSACSVQSHIGTYEEYLRHLGFAQKARNSGPPGSGRSKVPKQTGAKLSGDVIHASFQKTYLQTPARASTVRQPCQVVGRRF